MNQQINVRQRELEEQQRAMLSLAIAYVKDRNKGDYSKPIPLEDFLARFRVCYHSSEYASKRYFKDFVTLHVFEYFEGDKEFYLTTNKELQASMTYHFGVHFPLEPEPKPPPPEVAHKSGKRT